MNVLSDYVAAGGDFVVSLEGNPATPVERVVNDSRRVRPGDLFVAIGGAKVDGRRFVPGAVAAGAVAVACGGELEAPGVPLVRLGNDYAALGRFAELAAGYPARRLTCAGITGTNGKTTTAYLLRDILRAAGAAPAMLGTVAYEFGKVVREAANTTPDALSVQALFGEMVAAGCSHAVLEVSSHALAQRRLGTTPFAVAAFTNLTHDHRDYHPTMPEYFEAKARLFRESLTDGGTAVINVDCPWGRQLADELTAAKRHRVVTFSVDGEASIRAAKLALGLSESRVVLSTPVGELALRYTLTGRHNASNVMTAVGCALGLGIDPAAIRQAMEAFAGVPGRLQRLDGARGQTVFVDYAHTPDALANVLQALEPFRQRRLMVVFGCGGDRDRDKRREMAGEVAARADVIFVTSDNPRTEDPEQILDDAVKGIPAGKPYRREVDRRKAIEAAIGESGAGDIVLIAGKGHEPYQEINGVRYPFSDLEVARAALASGGPDSP